MKRTLRSRNPPADDQKASTTNGTTETPPANVKPAKRSSEAAKLDDLDAEWSGPTYAPPQPSWEYDRVHVSNITKGMKPLGTFPPKKKSKIRNGDISQAVSAMQSPNAAPLTSPIPEAREPLDRLLDEAMETDADDEGMDAEEKMNQFDKQHAMDVEVLAQPANSIPTITDMRKMDTNTPALGQWNEILEAAKQSAINHHSYGRAYALQQLRQECVTNEELVDTLIALLDCKLGQRNQGPTPHFRRFQHFIKKKMREYTAAQAQNNEDDTSISSSQSKGRITPAAHTDSELSDYDDDIADGPMPSTIAQPSADGKNTSSDSLPSKSSMNGINGQRLKLKLNKSSRGVGSGAPPKAIKRALSEAHVELSTDELDQQKKSRLRSFKHVPVQESNLREELSPDDHLEGPARKRQRTASSPLSVLDSEAVTEDSISKYRRRSTKNGPRIRETEGKVMQMKNDYGEMDLHPDERLPKTSAGLPPIDGGWAGENIEEPRSRTQYCAACRGNGTIVDCSGCFRSYHTFCLDPPMTMEQVQDSEEIRDNICAHETDQTEYDEDNPFLELLKSLDNRRPVVFQLPKEYHTYFDNTKATSYGTYSYTGFDEKPSTKKELIGTNAFVMKQVEDPNPEQHCLHCKKGARKDMPLFPCKKKTCNALWHLECLDANAATHPPGITHAFHCPAHLFTDAPKTNDDEHSEGEESDADDHGITGWVNSAPLHIGPAAIIRSNLRVRRVRNPKFKKILPVWARLMRNSIDVEINSDDEDESFEFEQDTAEEDGVVNKLPRLAITVNFAEKIKA
jgi:hypothetical protein